MIPYGSYNEDGLRLRKVVDGTDTEYYYNGSVLMYMITGRGECIMNNKKIVIIAVLIVLLLVNSLGCDNRGELTKEETINLLYEIQGNSYRDTIEDTRITFRVSDLSQDDQLLLLNASFGAFCSNSDYDSLSGRWFSSKRYCRTCIWYCNYSVEYSGRVFEIHEVSVSKYRDGKLYIVVRYYDNEDTSLEKSLEAEVSP